eukprot:435700-Hanusia_phi.AAC.1
MRGGVHNFDYRQHSECPRPKKKEENFSDCDRTPAAASPTGPSQTRARTGGYNFSTPEVCL